MASDKFRSIVIFGPPGCGKGTLCKTLASAGGHIHISSGEIFRNLSPNSPAGKIFSEYGHKGRLVPDEVTVQVWREYVDGLVASNRYYPTEQLLLLDGVPRTVRQTELFDSQIEVVRVIVLEVKNPEVLVQRLSRRAKIEGRVDDADPQVLRTRLEVYEKNTAPVLHHYPEMLISRFNAAQHPLEVLRDVLVELAGPLSERYRL